MAKGSTSVPPYTKATALKTWLDKASTVMRNDLTAWLETTDQMYSQWVSGRRGVSAEMAGRIDNGTRFISTRLNGPAPVLRGDVCAACSKCHYFLQHPDVVKRGKGSDLV